MQRCLWISSFPLHARALTYDRHVLHKHMIIQVLQCHQPGRPREM